MKRLNITNTPYMSPHMQVKDVRGSAVLINDNLYHLISLKVNRNKGANQRQGNVDRK